MDRRFDVINFISKCLYFKKADSRKELETLIKMQSTSVFLDIAKFEDFQRKNADVSRTQGLCHVIHKFFGSSLDQI